MPSTEAQKLASREWYARNRDRQRRLRKAWYEANKEKHMAASKAWKDAHRETVRAWGRRDAHKYYKPEKDRAWREANRERLKAMERARSKTPKYMVMNVEKAARRRRAVSPWADEAKVKAIYEEALRLTLETGTKYVVDHIVPLKSDLVCGLHNEFNLRVITQSENARKKNKFEVV